MIFYILTMGLKSYLLSFVGMELELKKVYNLNKYSIKSI